VEEGDVENWIVLLELVLMVSSWSAQKKQLVQRMQVLEKEDLKELAQIMRETLSKYCKMDDPRVEAVVKEKD